MVSLVGPESAAKPRRLRGVVEGRGQGFEGCGGKVGAALSAAARNGRVVHIYEPIISILQMVGLRGLEPR